MKKVINICLSKPYRCYKKDWGEDTLTYGQEYDTSEFGNDYDDDDEE